MPGSVREGFDRCIEDSDSLRHKLSDELGEIGATLPRQDGGTRDMSADEEIAEFARQSDAIFGDIRTPQGEIKSHNDTSSKIHKERASCPTGRRLVSSGQSGGSDE